MKNEIITGVHKGMNYSCVVILEDVVDEKTAQIRRRIAEATVELQKKTI